MAEAIITFQTQLSGVMETVFKAAMYEITRLVEDSFMEELTRCREQVETLKRRLKLAESRRKEKQEDGREKTNDCGRVGMSDGDSVLTAEKCLKQENVIEDYQSSDVGEEASNHCLENMKPEELNYSKAAKMVGVQANHFDGLLKDEAPPRTPEFSESQSWEISGDETDLSSLPGPSKRFSEQKKCAMNWETSFNQRSNQSQDGPSDDASEPLFHSRFAMNELPGFDKTGYGDGGIIDMSNFGALPDSPPQLADDLSYVDEYDEDVEAVDEAEPQCYSGDSQQNGEAAKASPTDSPSATNVNVSGEFSCLLINEQGYLHAPDAAYPDQASGNSGRKTSSHGQAIRFEPFIDTAEGTGLPSNAQGESLTLGERSQRVTAGKGARTHTCNQCAMSFPNSGSLKAHKLTHKATTQDSPYSCNQCGKTFSQPCNLKVHQRIHAGQGLHLCSHCGTGFTSFVELKTHACSQMGDKPYCCTVCGNKFSRLWNLKLHRRIHTQEKPHHCNMCEKSFTRADILKVHQRTHTGERPYCCPVCGLSFKRLDHLKSHQRKHMMDL